MEVSKIKNIFLLRGDQKGVQSMVARVGQQYIA